MPIRLWEAGYDVWLGNNRGTSHSQRHIQYHPEKEPKKYWDFSFAEIGMHDLPAMIKEIKHQLREQHMEDDSYKNIDKLVYFGYDQGATAMLYGLAKKELEFLHDVSEVILMAPCAKMQTTKGKTGYKFYSSMSKISDLLGLHAF